MLPFGLTAMAGELKKSTPRKEKVFAMSKENDLLSNKGWTLKTPAKITIEIGDKCDVFDQSGEVGKFEHKYMT
jgi:hypothetical protein